MTIKFISSIFIVFVIAGISIGQNYDKKIIDDPYIETNTKDANDIISIEPLVLGAVGNTVTAKEELTNVVINKAIEGTAERPRLKYNIITPKVDYFDFVLAIDSSGSFGLGGDESFQEAVASAIPLFLEDTKKRYPDKSFRISIVSWDDDIDFAYSNFSNKNPSDVQIVSLDTAIEDLKKNYVFDNRSLIDTFIGDNSINYFYKSEEDEYTDLSKPIRASLEIFRKNLLNENNFRTNRFILLITGKSEFKNCTYDLINESKQEDTRIYIISMNLNHKSKMFKHLKLLTGDNERQFMNIAPVPSNLRDELLKDLIHMVENATIEPVAEQVMISDTLFSYFDPDETSIKVNGIRGAVASPPNEFHNNDDTRTIEFMLKEGLAPQSITEVTFDVNLNLSGLPVDVANDQRTLPFKEISKDTKGPMVTYRWFNGKFRSLNLSGNKIDIQSAMPNQESILEIKSAKPGSQNKNLCLEFAIVTLFCLGSISFYKRSRR